MREYQVATLAVLPMPAILANFDRIAISIMIGVALVVFGATLARAVWQVPDWGDFSVIAGAAHEGIASSTPGSIPLRLAIESLGIDARVQQVGITGKGNIGIPSNFTDVAWYKLGVAPGVPGTAIMTGHVDNGLALPGVFKRLGELRAGDEITVTTRDRRTLRFVVYDVESYPYRQVPMDSIIAPKEDAELALISCEGQWLKQQRTYDRRIVVYARLAQ